MSYLKNKKNKKIINAVMVGIFCLSNAIPTVSFAAVTANSTANVQAKETAADKSVENNVNNNSGADSLGKKDLSGNNTSTSNEPKEDELVTLNKKQNEETKNQQKNNVSTNEATSYIVTDKNGESVTVTKNPCYMSTSESCKQTYSENVLNSAGEITSYRSVPLNTLKYTTSNQSALTANMEAQLNTQINMNNSLNNASTNGSVVTNYITNALSSLSPQASWSDKISAIGMALMSGLQAQQQIEKQAESNQQLLKTTTTLNAINDARNEIAQQKRNVLQQTSTRYIARLTPTIPVINDNLDVTLTLVTSNKTANDNNNDYTIKAKVLNQDTKKWVWLNVSENQPFTVEKGNWKNRTIGNRTIEIVYTFNNNTKAPEESTITYNVGQMANAILPDGRNVTNSVTALTGNADILNYNQSTTGVAGKITKAKWVKDGSASYCAISLTDDKDNTGKYSEVAISTNNIPEDKCNDKIIGNYASFTDVSVKTNNNGEYVFQDLSNSSSVNYAMSEANYNDLENSIAKTTQEEQAKTDTPSLIVDKTTGLINIALPGEIGINYVYIPAWKTCLAVSEDTDGTISFKKADGTAYTEEELKNKIPTASETYKNVTFGKDENGKIYAMSSGKVISSGFDTESLSSSSKSINLTSLQTYNLINKNKTTTYADMALNIISNTTNSVKNSITHVANLGSLTDDSSYNNNNSNNTVNLVTGTYNIIPENNSVNTSNNAINDIFEQGIKEGCKNKTVTECNLFKQQLDSININK